MDDQVVFTEMTSKEGALWGMFVASGYLKMLPPAPKFTQEPRELKITNYETQLAFDDMVQGWLGPAHTSYSNFVKALLMGDTHYMGRFLSEVLLACASTFDGATYTADRVPRLHYHPRRTGLRPRAHPRLWHGLPR